MSLLMETEILKELGQLDEYWTNRVTHFTPLPCAKNIFAKSNRSKLLTMTTCRLRYLENKRRAHFHEVERADIAVDA